MQDTFLLLKALVIPWKRGHYISKLLPESVKEKPQSYLSISRKLGVEGLTLPYGRDMRVEIDLCGRSISEEIIKMGSYQSWLVRALVRLNPNLVECVFVNVGANIGTSCMNAKAVGFSDFIAIEPAKKNFELLIRNLRANDIEAKCLNNAVGSEKKTTRLYLNVDSGGRHSVLARSSADLYEDVSTVTLDDLDIEKSFVLWLDVEGYELEVLRGGVQKLRESCVAACVEVSPSISGPTAAVETLEVMEEVFSSFFNDKGDPVDTASLKESILSNEVKQIDLLALR
jgi:FkbM family methyltransferase